jgi:uncharacterized 2Fe-2S/4Fe-4S cluster protein (DUF4445 family)/ferredoxin
MTGESWRVELPDGTCRAVPAPHADSGTLATWLENNGIALNTRCGQRGWCHGCKIEWQHATGSQQTVRSCQLMPDAVPPDVALLRVPLRSQRGESLHGLRSFEVRTPLTQPWRRPGLGLALDIGTTTLAGALWDLQSGICLATAAQANPQRSFGDNVVSRIAYACDQPTHNSHLQQVLIDGGIRPLVDALCELANCDSATISAATAVGNTVMLHSLAGAPLAGFSRYPFKPQFLAAHSLSAAALGLPWSGAIDLPPSLGPFVGADLAVGALAAGIAEPGPPALLIDFGTNGEMLLRTPSGFWATATAVGPAFEGGRLRCGGPAGPNVVTRLSYADGSWQLTVLDASPGTLPRALAGSAYIDLLAIGRAHGMLTAHGRMVRSHPAVQMTTIDGDLTPCIQIVDTLLVTEPDIAELMQAKAAIGAGIATLLHHASMAATDLVALHLAGGFGYHLPVRHALAIGLLPALPADRIQLHGNTALGGASFLLQSVDNQALDMLVAQTQVIELNTSPGFEDRFIDNLALDC